MDTPIFGSPFFDRSLPELRQQLREFETRLLSVDNMAAAHVVNAIRALENTLIDLEHEAKRISLQSKMNDHLAAAGLLKKQIAELS